MIAHSHHLGNDSLVCPVHAEDLRKLPQVDSSSFTNREHGIAQPAHAKVAQLLVKEVDAELACQQGNIFDDGKSHSPLLVLGQLHNSGE